jgi:integrase
VGRDLTALAVKALTKPGVYRVSRNLYLQVTDTGGRSWLFRYMLRGLPRYQGLGACDLVTLAEAREKVLAGRRLAAAGIDPLAERRAAKAKLVTFADCAERYIAAHQAGWKNDKHRAQWGSTLATYVNPVIGQLPVDAIDTGLVMKLLEPIWSTKPETASRVRGRIESILDWATARGYRQGDNPARWRGHLQRLLPARSKVAPVEHHAALPYAEMPAFMTTLRQQAGTGARALELTILTAARTGEAIGARWDEIDMKARTWTVPSGRMKSGKPHTVPLSEQAVALLAALPRGGALVFENSRAGQPISNMAMTMTLRRMGRDELTVHGFRSTFRDWAAEQTGHPNHVVEMALAHTIGNGVEAAYRRGDLLEKRRLLMRDWAAYCAG